MTAVIRLVRRATLILRDDDNNERLKDIFESLDDIEKYSFEKGDYYQFYAMIALEAFHYESVTGSIRTLEWVIDFLNQLHKYVKDWRDQFVILLDFGFTMYNYARDAMHRYAIPRREQNLYFKLSDQYCKFVVQFTKRSDITTRKLYQLVFLSEAIRIALLIATPSTKQVNPFELAMRKSTNVFKFHRDNPTKPCPCILLGLHFYLSGKLHHLRGKNDLAWKIFNKAISCLKQWKDSTASQPSYFYDVIYDKYNN